jgi:hypothetical protein
MEKIINILPPDEWQENCIDEPDYNGTEIMSII